jgi:hypothetical protein
MELKLNNLLNYNLWFTHWKKNTCSNPHDKLTLYYDISFKFDSRLGQKVYLDSRIVFFIETFNVA